MTILAIILLAGSFVLSVILTVAARKLAVRAGLVAQPAEDRYHRTVIPLGGGIAIFTTLMVFIMVVLAALFFLAADQILSWLVSLTLGLGG